MLLFCYSIISDYDIHKNTEKKKSVKYTDTSVNPITQYNARFKIQVKHLFKISELWDVNSKLTVVLLLLLFGNKQPSFHTLGTFYF